MARKALEVHHLVERVTCGDLIADAPQHQDKIRDTPGGGDAKRVLASKQVRVGCCSCIADRDPLQCRSWAWPKRCTLVTG